MTLLSKVTAGKLKKPYFLLCYGPEGVGKSTFASNAPDSVWIDFESGSDELDVTRLPGFAPEDGPTLDRVYQAIDELLTTPHAYKTFVIDSLSKLEPILQAKVISKAAKKDKEIESIEDFGYGKGITKAVEEWQVLMTKLATLRNKMNVVILGHSIVKKFDNPQTNSAYDRFNININDKAGAIVKAAVSAILFATEEIATKKDENKKIRAYGDGTRVIYTERRPSFEAKNRYGLPFQIALDWESFDRAARVGNPDSPEAIRGRITGMVSELQDKELTEKVEGYVKAAGEDAKRLAQVENKLKIRMGETEA